MSKKGINLVYIMYTRVHEHGLKYIVPQRCPRDDREVSLDHLCTCNMWDAALHNRQEIIGTQSDVMPIGTLASFALFTHNTVDFTNVSR